ncbi:MAG: hypothetical protein AB7W59_03340 [Acidimicrobiia bacterium]
MALLAIIGGASLIGIAVQLYRDAANVGERAATLQAIAAGVSLIATVLLLLVTTWYAVLTRDLLHKSGPIVSTDLRVGWIPDVIGPPINVLTSDVAQLWKGPPEHRYPIPVWAIVVRNSGNAPARVQAVSVALDGGLSLRTLQMPFGKTPPYNVEPHDSETFYMPLDESFVAAKLTGEVLGRETKRFRAEVVLAVGDTVTSRWEPHTN